MNTRITPLWEVAAGSPEPPLPTDTLPRYTRYISSYEDHLQSPLPMRGVLPVVEVMRGLVKQACDTQTGGVVLEEATPHAKTLLMSQALTLAGITHALYEFRTKSGIAIATMDYPDGTGAEDYYLFSSGQHRLIQEGTQLSSVLYSAEDPATWVAKIDRALGRKGVAACTVDPISLVGDVGFKELTARDPEDPDPTPGNPHNPWVLQLYSLDQGAGALTPVDPRKQQHPTIHPEVQKALSQKQDVVFA